MSTNLRRRLLVSSLALGLCACASGGAPGGSRDSGAASDAGGSGAGSDGGGGLADGGSPDAGGPDCGDPTATAAPDGGWLTNAACPHDESCAAFMCDSTSRCVAGKCTCQCPDGCPCPDENIGALSCQIAPATCPGG